MTTTPVTRAGRDDLIRLRRGDDTVWENRDPVLDDGEPGWARDSRTLKVGDGATPWSDLEGITGGGEPGQPGPPGPPGPPGTFPDVPDLTILFENGLL